MSLASRGEPSGGEYQVKLIDSLHKWKKISKDWGSLLNSSRANTVFLSWEWLYSWGECFLSSGRELFILLVYKNNKLVGAAPFYLAQAGSHAISFKEVRFIGSPEGGADYLDVIVRKGEERNIALCLYNFLLTKVSSLWGRLSLRDVPSNSLFLMYFVEALEQDGKYFDVRLGSFCPTVKLASTFDTFLQGLSANRRQQFKRHLKILTREDGFRYSAVTGDDVLKHLSSFFRLYALNRPTDAPRLRAFVAKQLQKMHPNKSMRLDFLCKNEDVFAGALHFDCADGRLMYLIAVDKKRYSNVSAGGVLIGLCIEDAIKMGLNNYDFLKGCEDYKFHWTLTGNRSVDFTFCQKKVRPAIHLVKQNLKNVLKYFLR